MIFTMHNHGKTTVNWRVIAKSLHPKTVLKPICRIPTEENLYFIKPRFEPLLDGIESLRNHLWKKLHKCKSWNFLLQSFSPEVNSFSNQTNSFSVAYMDTESIIKCSFSFYGECKNVWYFSGGNCAP